MGVSLCTGPRVKEELQAILLITVEWEFMQTPVSSQLCKTVLPLNTCTGTSGYFQV